jgi:hypothetical protein
MCLFAIGGCPGNIFPAHLQGVWYSIDQGNEIQTEIAPEKMFNKLMANGICSDLFIFNETIDAQGNYDALVYVKNT